MHWLIPIFLTVLAGISLVIQQVMNANLKAEIHSGAWSGFMSYFTGVMCMALFVAVLREPIPPVSAMARVPIWAWFGGVFGAIFIALSVFLIPQIGAATFMALLITGQMAGSVAFDHFGIMGLTERPIDLSRILAVAFLIAGVVLIQRE